MKGTRKKLAESVMRMYGQSRLLRAIVLGVARWESFPDDSDCGEICVGGLRYPAKLDDCGLPIVGELVKDRLDDAVTKAEESGV